MYVRLVKGTNMCYVARDKKRGLVNKKNLYLDYWKRYATQLGNICRGIKRDVSSYWWNLSFIPRDKSRAVYPKQVDRKMQWFWPTLNLVAVETGEFYLVFNEIRFILLVHFGIGLIYFITFFYLFSLIVDIYFLI